MYEHRISVGGPARSVCASLLSAVSFRELDMMKMDRQTTLQRREYSTKKVLWTSIPRGVRCSLSFFLFLACHGQYSASRNSSVAVFSGSGRSFCRRAYYGLLEVRQRPHPARHGFGTTTRQSVRLKHNQAAGGRACMHVGSSCRARPRPAAVCHWTRVAHSAAIEPGSHSPPFAPKPQIPKPIAPARPCSEKHARLRYRQSRRTPPGSTRYIPGGCAITRASRGQGFSASSSLSRKEKQRSGVFRRSTRSLCSAGAWRPDI